MKMTEIIKGIAQMYRSNRQDINPEKFQISVINKTCIQSDCILIPV